MYGPILSTASWVRIEFEPHASESIEFYVQPHTAYGTEHIKISATTLCSYVYYIAPVGTFES